MFGFVARRWMNEDVENDIVAVVQQWEFAPAFASVSNFRKLTEVSGVSVFLYSYYIEVKGAIIPPLCWRRCVWHTFKITHLNLFEWNSYYYCTNTDICSKYIHTDLASGLWDVPQPPPYCSRDLSALHSTECQTFVLCLDVLLRKNPRLVNNICILL